MNVISFNKRKYGELLAESVPTVIRTEFFHVSTDLLLGV